MNTRPPQAPQIRKVSQQESHILLRSSDNQKSPIGTNGKKIPICGCDHCQRTMDDEGDHKRGFSCRIPEGKRLMAAIAPSHTEMPNFHFSKAKEMFCNLLATIKMSNRVSPCPFPGDGPLLISPHISHSKAITKNNPNEIPPRWGFPATKGESRGRKRAVDLS